MNQHAEWLRDLGALYGKKLDAERCRSLNLAADEIDRLTSALTDIRDLLARIVVRKHDDDETLSIIDAPNVNRLDRAFQIARPVSREGAEEELDRLAEQAIEAQRRFREKSEHWTEAQWREWARGVARHEVAAGTAYDKWANEKD